MTSTDSDVVEAEVVDEQQEPGIDESWEDPPRSIEEAAEDEPEQEPAIEGGKRSLTLTAGGEEPDSSSFKMQGGKVAVEGQFDKGDVIDLLVKVRVAEVDFVDKVDNDGYVVGTERRHLAKPLSIRRP